jgi:hypothetical protein
LLLVMLVETAVQRAWQDSCLTARGTCKEMRAGDSGLYDVRRSNTMWHSKT